jgi:hypothetical protein
MVTGASWRPTEVRSRHGGRTGSQNTCSTAVIATRSNLMGLRGGGVFVLPRQLPAVASPELDDVASPSSPACLKWGDLNERWPPRFQADLRSNDSQCNKRSNVRSGHSPSDRGRRRHRRD